MSLLVAGPAAVDDAGLLAGGGALAAISGVPFMAVQLWARLGPQAQALEALRRRGIRIEGVGEEGPAVRCVRGADPAPEPLLPAVEPTEAEGLGGALVIGLDAAEEARAVAVTSALAPAARILVVERSLPADAAGWVLVARLSAASRLTGQSDPLAAARALQGRGAKSAIVTCGMLGGLIVHGELSTTYPSLPQPPEAVLPSGAALAAFSGALAGWCAGAGVDFNGLKRGAAVGSAVAGLLVHGGVRRLMGADRAQCLERFNRLRRAAKA